VQSTTSNVPKEIIRHSLQRPQYRANSKNFLLYCIKHQLLDRKQKHLFIADSRLISFLSNYISNWVGVNKGWAPNYSGKGRVYTNHTLEWEGDPNSKI